MIKKDHLNKKYIFNRLNFLNKKLIFIKKLNFKFIILLLIKI